MNALYAAWLRREARERFDKTPCELTADELEAIEGPPCEEEYDLRRSRLRLVTNGEAS